MHLAVLGMLVVQVFRHVLGQQMAAVAGGVNQHIGRRGGDRAVQGRLQSLVAGFALVKAEVVAKDDELLGPGRDQIDNLGQIDHVRFIHLDQAQALVCKRVQASADQRRFAGAACPCQQGIVGATPLHKLLRIAQKTFFLNLHLFQVRKADVGNVLHRYQHAVAGTLAPVTHSDRCAPVGFGNALVQRGFHALHEALGPLQKLRDARIGLNRHIRSGNPR